MSQTALDEEHLRSLIKSAVMEALEERQDLLREAVEEALEHLGLGRAIDEGASTPFVSREDVMKVLESPE